MNRFPQPYFRSQRGTWCVQLDGKQITLGRDKNEAFREYHRLMLNRGEASPPTAVQQPDALLVATALDQFLDWLHCRVAEGTKAERTYTWYRKYLQSFATFSTPDYRVANLTVDRLQPLHVYQWVDSHLGWKTGRRGAMTAVQRAFNWAAKAGVLRDVGGKSPLTTLEKPPQGRREQLISDEEYAEVLTVITAPEARDLLVLSWETGMRPHELFTAEARYFEPEGGRLVFPVRLSKGKKVQRVVYLSETALEVVRRNAATHPMDALLRNTEGAAWSGAAVNCLFQRVRRELGQRRMKAAGVMPPKIKRLTAPERKDKEKRQEHERRVLERRQLVHRLAWEHGTKYSLYAFRHAWVTEALVSGVDAVTVSVLAGHRDTTMIARHYAHCAQRTERLDATTKNGLKQVATDDQGFWSVVRAGGAAGDFGVVEPEELIRAADVRGD
jgi:integrase